MNVREAVEEYEFATLRQSTKTRVWKFNKLKFFVEWCEKQEISDIKDIRPTHVRRFLDDMSHRQGRSKSSTETWEKKISSFTLRGYGQSVKGFLTWCRKEEYIDTDVSKRIELVKTDDKVIEIFTSEQMRALFDACKHEYNDRLVARDKAILAVLFDTGIRVSELCGLTLDNVSLDNDMFIKVMGKGRKEREVGLGHRTVSLLRRYISRSRGKFENEHHVFLNRSNEPITPNGIEQVFIRLGAWAKIRDVRCSAHTCRHTFAVNYLLNGGDIYKLSRLMGHESVQITEIYLKAVTQREVRSSGFSLIDKLDR